MKDSYLGKLVIGIMNIYENKLYIEYLVLWYWEVWIEYLWDGSFIYVWIFMRLKYYKLISYEIKYKWIFMRLKYL